MICSHEGWGRYADETGPCPDPVAMASIPNGVECPACGFRIETYSGPDAEARAFTAAHNRETATLAREVR